MFSNVNLWQQSRIVGRAIAADRGGASASIPLFIVTYMLMFIACSRLRCTRGVSVRASFVAALALLARASFVLVAPGACTGARVVTARVGSIVGGLIARRHGRVVMLKAHNLMNGW